MVMIITRTYTETSKLSKGRHYTLTKFLDVQNVLYNCTLQERSDCYRLTGESITEYDQYKSLTTIRANDPNLAKYGVKATRSSLRRIDRAFNNFYRRCKEKAKKPGAPMFKPRHQMKSYVCPSSGFRIRESGNYWAILIKGLKPFIVKNIRESDKKEIRIVRTAKRVKVKFVVEQEVDVTPSTADFVGIDLRVSNLATFSNGKKIKGRKLKLAKQKARQRKLNLKSRKGKNGKPWDHRKAKRWNSGGYRSALSLFSKEGQTLREQELGFLHWLTSKIIKDHPDLLVEQLQILKMVKNHKLARSILEQKWETFIRMLDYKAERAGGRVVKVNPANTSKTCSGCGSVKAVLLLSERVYSRSNCGIEVDRDVNAARNILRLEQAMSSAGVSAGEFGNDSKQIDGVELWRGVVERIQNILVTHKSTI